MKIKGHSIIELKNVNTGEIERFEDDNMVTNALQLMLQDTGMLWNSPIKLNEIRNTPMKTLLGGLLLFDQPLTENANNVIFPGGMHMIGNGAAEYVADGEDGVTEFGSWNYTESGWMNDGTYAMVWDFTTTQANGTIACASLTSRRNGYVGVGNYTSNHRRSATSSNVLIDNHENYYLVDPDDSQLLNRIFDVSVTNSKITYVDNKNIVYSSATASDHMSLTGNLKLITKKIPITKFDLRESYEFNNEGGQNFIPSVETNIALPSIFISALGNSTPSIYGRYGNYFYMVAPFNSGVGSVTHGVRINCDTKVAESFTITNNTDSAFAISNFGVTFGSDTVALYTTGGSSNRVVFQDIFDNSDTDEVSVTLQGAFGGYDSDGGAMLIRESGCIMGHDMYIDLVNRTVTPVNTSLYGRFGRFLSNDNPFFYNYSYKNNGYWGMEFFAIGRTTDYIATINNLAEPVTKTPEKTMKVTYLLSFSD